MMSDDSDQPHNADSPSVGPVGRWWLRGVLLAAMGVVIGAVALALFCYALGVNLTDEGRPKDHQVDPVTLAGSCAGFAIATLLFWIGFVQVTRATQ